LGVHPPTPRVDSLPCFSPPAAAGHLVGDGPRHGAGGRQRPRLGGRPPLPLEHITLRGPAPHGPPRPLDLPPCQGPLGLSLSVCPSCAGTPSGGGRATHSPQGTGCGCKAGVPCPPGLFLPLAAASPRAEGLQPLLWGGSSQKRGGLGGWGSPMGRKLVRL